MSANQQDKHMEVPDASFDGGDLDCGNGLLLLIRKHLDSLDPGQLLEIKSREPSVEVDLPAWCRLTKNDLVSWTKHGVERSYLVRKANNAALSTGGRADTNQSTAATSHAPAVEQTGGAPQAVPRVQPLSVMGIGSWPRPRWMLLAIHDYLAGRLAEEEFQESANDAVRLAVEQQVKAGADVVTDGEQRRDNYSSFVGTHLENVQMIPLVDLLPLVDHPEEFERQLQALDVPAELVRHPAVFGKLARRGTLAAHECVFARQLTAKPIKVSLPGPYLLSRTMFLECFKERAYESRQQISVDIVRILREEISDLLAAGASLVQLDEPILTEVVFAGAKKTTSFMCGAVSERGEAAEELEFAIKLLNEVVQGFPRERIGMHVCRGNWSPDEAVALQGGYEDLLPVFQRVPLGAIFLEFCTPRAGDIRILEQLPKDAMVGVGVVNPKSAVVETVEEIVERATRAASYIGKDRLLLTPDCGFATFADNPVSTSEVAAAKLSAIAEAARRLKN